MSLRASYTAEQGLIPSYNFVGEQRVILKAHSLAQISKKPTAIQKSTSVCLTVLSLTDISQQKILYGCKIAIQKTNKSDINSAKK